MREREREGKREREKENDRERQKKSTWNLHGYVQYSGVYQEKSLFLVTSHLLEHSWNTHLMMHINCASSVTMSLHAYENIGVDEHWNNKHIGVYTPLCHCWSDNKQREALGCPRFKRLAGPTHHPLQTHTTKLM